MFTTTKGQGELGEGESVTLVMIIIEAKDFRFFVKLNPIFGSLWTN